MTRLKILPALIFVWSALLPSGMAIPSPGEEVAVLQISGSRTHPRVIMGDFNSVEIAQQLMREEAQDGRQLHTTGGNSELWHSYKDRRLDWILLSGELEFVEYRTYPEVLSDHRLVAAHVAMKQAAATEEQP